MKVLKELPRRDFKTKISHWRHKFLGPTTVHLQHEFCLLITLTFLTNASLISLYRSSFGSAPNKVFAGFLPADYFYLLLTFTCLSRHLLHRILCTTETGTSLSHPIWHWRDHLARVWTWAFSGGHAFDTTRLLLTSAHYEGSHILSTGRSDPQNFQDFASGGSNVGMTLSLNSGSVGMAPSIPIHRNKYVARFFVSPLVVSWAFWQWINTKLRSRTKEDMYDLDDWTRSGAGVARHHHRSSMSSSSSSTNTDRHIKRNSNGGGGFDAKSLNIGPDSDFPKDATLAHFIVSSRRRLNIKLDQIWVYMPQAQMVIAVGALGLIILFGVHAMTFLGPRGGLMHAWTKWWRKGTDLGYTNFHGMNVQQERSKIELTLNSELMNLKFNAMQQYNNNIANAKQMFYGPWGMLCMVLVSGTFTSLVFYGRVILPAPDLTCTAPSVSKGSGKSSKAPQRVEKPWSESYKSISSENRFYLHLKVGILRLLENLIVCAILPQSEFVCKATGHCDTDTIMTGYFTWSDGNSMFDYMIRDRTTSFIIALSVAVVTILMLVAQAVALDKTFLALKGNDGLEATGNNNQRNSMSSATGNRRGGKKLGNLSDNGRVGRGRWNTTSTSKIQQYGQMMFANELGPLSTSSILAVCSYVHTLYSLLLVLICAIYAAIGKDWYSLVLTFIAIFISTSDIAVTEHDDFEAIAKELLQGYKTS